MDDLTVKLSKLAKVKQFTTSSEYDAVSCSTNDTCSPLLSNKPGQTFEE